MRLGRLGFKNKLLVRRVSVITGIEVGLQFANNGTSRGPGGVWRGGFHPSVFNTKEDLRIVKEEVQKVREARFHKLFIGLKGVCNYGSRNVNGLEAWMLMLGLVRAIV